jgi:hypothetical protein
MKAFKAPKVGENVFVYSGKGLIRNEESYCLVEVVKVGRKWFTTKDGAQFSIESGKSNSEYSYPIAICAEQLKHLSAVQLATRWLAAYGVRLSQDTSDAKLLEVYRALADASVTGSTVF